MSDIDAVTGLPVSETVANEALRRIHKALNEYGRKIGSEYTDVGGMVRAIREICQDRDQSREMTKAGVIARNKATAARDEAICLLREVVTPNPWDDPAKRSTWTSRVKALIEKVEGQR